MNRHRHHRRRSIRKPYVGPGESDLHEVLREIACGMPHMLMRCCDVDTGGVVVSPEVRSAKASVACIQDPGEKRCAFSVENDLRCLHHQLELERSISESEFFLEISKHCDRVV